jgi:hypothetical protein
MKIYIVAVSLLFLFKVLYDLYEKRTCKYQVKVYYENGQRMYTAKFRWRKSAARFLKWAQDSGYKTKGYEKI